MTSLIRKPRAAKPVQGRNPWGRVSPQFYCQPVTFAKPTGKVGLVKAGTVQPYRPTVRPPRG